MKCKRRARCTHNLILIYTHSTTSKHPQNGTRLPNRTEFRHFLPGGLRNAISCSRQRVPGSPPAPLSICAEHSVRKQRNGHTPFVLFFFAENIFGHFCSSVLICGVSATHGPASWCLRDFVKKKKNLNKNALPLHGFCLHRADSGWTARDDCRVTPAVDGEGHCCFRRAHRTGPRRRSRERGADNRVGRLVILRVMSIRELHWREKRATFWFAGGEEDGGGERFGSGGGTSGLATARIGCRRDSGWRAVRTEGRSNSLH